MRVCIKMYENGTVPHVLNQAMTQLTDYEDNGGKAGRAYNEKATLMPLRGHELWADVYSESQDLNRAIVKHLHELQSKKRWDDKVDCMFDVYQLISCNGAVKVKILGLTKVTDGYDLEEKSMLFDTTQDEFKRNILALQLQTR